MGIFIIADPVLDPPLQGLALSLQRYLLFRQDHPDIPLFFGAGNVTELMDADTVGVNALLAALGAETGASILFTPEYSGKAAGSVHELALASRMMLLARERHAPPKDLGLDLLILKEKRRLPEEAMPETFMQAKEGHKYEPDDRGSFRIFLSRGLILAQNGRDNCGGKECSRHPQYSHREGFGQPPGPCRLPGSRTGEGRDRSSPEKKLCSGRTSLVLREKLNIWSRDIGADEI